MPVKITSVQPDSYLKDFEITNLPSLCIVTGLNGSGKTRLLTNISNGSVAIDINSQRVTLRRILNFDSSAFNNYQGISRHGRPGYMGHNASSDTLQNIMHRGYDSEGIIEAIKNETGALDQEVDDKIRRVVYSGNTEDITKLISSLANKTYSHSTSQTLKSFYDAQVSNEMSNIAKDYNLPVGKLPELFDVENMLNSILDRLKLPYEIYGGEDYKNYIRFANFRSMNALIPIDQDLEGLFGEGRFEIRLKNKNSNSIISINSLSSGEKALLAIAAIIVGETQKSINGLRPLVLLLDEPDAHLHPDYAQLLVDIIKSEFIEKFKFSVILTTHSPITLAVSEIETSLLVKSGVVESVPTAIALNTLMSGVPHIDVLNRSNIYVFTESFKDSRVYREIFGIVSKTKNYHNTPLFIASANDARSNCELVKHLVENLPDERTIHGVIDWDLKNMPVGNLHVMAHSIRYTIENALFDPLCLLSLLISRGHNIPEEIGLHKNINMREFIQEPSYFNDFCSKLARYIIEDYTSQKFKDCKYFEGNTIPILQSYLEIKGHDLEDIIITKFPQLKMYGRDLRYEIIKIMNEYPEIIPMDFVTLYDEILTKDEIQA
jgi:energy-coupling factor transporter ATP-binding protein EcfA2